jgi:hypothetical protein
VVAHVASADDWPSLGFAPGPLAAVSRRHRGTASYLSLRVSFLYSSSQPENDPEDSSVFVGDSDVAALFQGIGLGSMEEYLDATEVDFAGIDSQDLLLHGGTCSVANIYS